MWKRLLPTLPALMLAMAAPATAATRLVVFPLELVDTSTEGDVYGKNPAETARLARITRQLYAAMDASELYEIVDLAPAAAQLDALRESVQYLHDCNNCELEIARALDAELILIGWVQKVSNLILNLNVLLKDASSGEIVRQSFVDIRGNNDRSWERGTRYMLKHRLLPP